VRSARRQGNGVVSIRIELSKDQRDYCRRKGIERHERAEAMGLDPEEAYDGSFKQRDRHIDGVLGEACFALACGLKRWRPTMDKFKEPDVLGYQVRATRYEDGHLLMRPKDKKCAHEEFALVILDDSGGNVFTKSITGRDGLNPWEPKDENKREGFWRPKDAKGKGAWWVPQSKLTNNILIIVGW